MPSRAKIRKHPVHPMIVPIPIGLWVFSLFCDVIYQITKNSVWDQVALYTIAGGIAGALLAAVPGWLDYSTFKDPKLKQIGRFHMIINLGAVLLFGINFWLRIATAESSLLPLLLSLIGVAAIGISGWLGGEMVYVYGVGVEPEKGVGDLEEDLRRHMTQKSAHQPPGETHPTHH